MNGVSNRKKSFLDELIRNYANFIMVLAVILYFTIAGIIGNALLKSDDIITGVIKGMVCGLVIICLAGIIIYAIEAIEMYGVFLGGWLALKRILRCNPFNKNAYGFDPVPVGRYGKRKKQ